MNFLAKTNTQKSSLRRPALAISLALIFLLPFLLYGNFISNPIVFDDIDFFLKGTPEKLIDYGLQYYPRWWVHYTLSLQFFHIGPEISGLRLGNLLLHVASGWVLFLLLSRLISDLDPPKPGLLKPEWMALLASLLFVLHPVAVYAAGYLIQRTIIAATLFSLLSWLAFWKGLQESRNWLWLSALCYFIAVYAKEHAIMAPAISLALLLLHQRSGLTRNPKTLELLALFITYGATAIVVILHVKGVIGTAYEIYAPDILENQSISVSPELAYPLSVLTQANLFFKYLTLWLIPNLSWMSIDMREPFALSITWINSLGFLLFCIYPFIALLFLWQGNGRGLVGLSMLAPWLLFATEISTVRIQEIFVLYRSYLWFSLTFISIALGLRRMQLHAALSLSTILICALFAFSFDRLTSFSHKFLLWDEAAQVAEKNGVKTGVTGLDRIYYNRGLAAAQVGMLENAIKDYERAISINPKFSQAFHNRGSVRMDLANFEAALADFNMALKINPSNLKSYAGRALALEKLKRTSEAQTAHLQACHMGWTASCKPLP